MKTINKFKLQLLLITSSMLLVACGGDNQSNPEPAKVTTLSGVMHGGGGSNGNSGNSNNSNNPSNSPALSCDQLNGMQIPAAIIGLATTGATVTSTAIVPTGPQQLYTVGQYCRVFGDIHPVDPNAPPIKFQLNLPDNWNHKAMMFGGGGYNGVLSTFPSGLNNTLISGADHASPLSRGYATFGSNSGHILQPPYIFGRDASFAVNDEALVNYTGDALKKTHDTAKYLINLYYQSLPQKTYFQGGSTGGKEAMIVMQRWPQDFDGVIALFPAWNSAAMTLQMGRISRAFAQSGAYLNNEKRKLILDASIANCDKYDNVLDGIISNVAACNAQFDPATASVDGTAYGAKLRCAGGVDIDNSCLSDAQINALKVFATPLNLGYTLASGEKGYPGYHVWGTDLGVPSSNPDLALIGVTGLNLVQPANPVNPNMPFMTAFYDQWMKYFVTRDANFNGLGVDPQNPGVWQARINQLSLLQDNNNTNLQAFEQKGGKFLLVHGMADAAVSARASADYYQRLQDKMGKGKVKSFVRYWEIPGYGHAVSPTFNATFDVVSVLENWAESGIKPKNLVTADKTGVIGRTRPLCDFPKWPKYKNGDVNLASSFKCVKGDEDEEDDD